MHRNTLVYRLEKIKKLTGLDLREFDDAIVFKVALMVKKYLSNNPASIGVERPVLFACGNDPLQAEQAAGVLTIKKL